jgi:hypothetical protein
MSSNNQTAHGGAGAGAGDEPPSAASYRICPEDINETVCLGRRIVEKDKRWKPAVFYEGQCGKPVLEGADLCAVCSRRLEKFAAEEDAAKAVKVGWTGQVTEEPPDWLHMLGTAWAETKKPKWLGGGAAAGSASASEAGSVSGAEEAPAPKKPKKEAMATENAALRSALVRAEAAAAAEKARADAAEARAVATEARAAAAEAKLAAIRAAMDA